VRILAASPGDTSGEQYLTTFVVDDLIAIDAGCLGLHATTRPFCGLEHVFLTHAHIDHIGTLPLFLENCQGRGTRPVRVHGPAEALDALRDHLFNDRVWLDHARIGSDGRGWIELEPIEPEKAVALDGFRIVPVPVAHTVPTFGYVVDDGRAAVVFGADSGPTDRIWEVARATGRLRAAFVECSFPDEFGDLAARTGHLTPRLWAGEAAKLPADAAVIAVHLKPGYRGRVRAELAALGDRRVQVGELGREYSF
jgi:ribonuclease BN (tRNA processing enzyme)